MAEISDVMKGMTEGDRLHVGKTIKHYLTEYQEKNLNESHKPSLSEVASLIGISHATLINATKGRIISDETLERICGFFGIRNSELYASTYLEKLQYSEGAALKDISELKKKAEEKGIDEQFMEYLISNFDIPHETEWNLLDYAAGERPQKVSRPKIESPYSYKEDGESFLINENDLNLIKAIQDSVKGTISSILIRKKVQIDKSNLKHTVEVLGPKTIEHDGEKFRIEQTQNGFNSIVDFAINNVMQTSRKEVVSKLEQGFKMKYKGKK